MHINSQHHKPNFDQIRGFLYFDGHFWFKMAAIAKQNGHDMVQHVLLPVNIHFHWNIFIFEFLTIYFNFFNFYIGGHFENFKNRAQLWVMIHFCVKFQKDPLYGFRLTFFAPWLPWQQPPFWIFFNPQKLPHTTVGSPTKFHEVWWKESKKKSFGGHNYQN